MLYVFDVLNAVLYVNCFVVFGCSVCYCDLFSACDVYLNPLKFYVICVNGLMYVSCC